MCFTASSDASDAEIKDFIMLASFMHDLRYYDNVSSQRLNHIMNISLFHRNFLINGYDVTELLILRERMI
ncbi:hypothetical protein AAC03nite_00800 [Alicyclobacillus acidoterrestris]|nr:hypothetical protein AAC03nite_00800 [Alicyclobacillus acidoterrestris]